MRLPTRTQESDEEDEGTEGAGASGHGVGHGSSKRQSGGNAGSSTDSDEEELEEGMLLRDLPKRTTFYDPVAERQMSQTDAKFFYHRNKTDLRNGARTGSQATPLDSPMILSGSRPATEYGNDSLVLDLDGHENDAHGRPLGMESSIPGAEFGFGSEIMSKFRGQSTVQQTSQPLSREPQGFQTAKVSDVSNIGLSDGSIFDTEPHITAELSAISKNIQRILDLRRKYIALSLQGPEDNPRDSPEWEVYPPPPEPAWKQASDALAGVPEHVPGHKDQTWHDPGHQGDHRQPQHSRTWPQTQGTKRHYRKRKPGQDIGEDFDMDDLLPLPEEDEMTFKLDDSGVYQLFEDDEASTPAIQVPTIREFYMDLDDILNVSSDGPSKSFAFRRLQYLEGKFNLYILLNEYQETADSKKVPHRDFYNVRKVDTHVHHSACMNQKHLLRFIKSKMKKFPNEVVLYRDGRHLTLAEVFASINLTAYDLSIDTLDMHVSDFISF